jgi:hypothetical protein
MHSWNRLRRVLMLVALATALAGCGDKEEVATDREAIPNASPTALAALPDDIEEATVLVESGTFLVEELVLSRGEPTVLHVVNADDRAYRLTITEDLVRPTLIAASGTTNVGFTTPDADVYEGQLLAAERDNVLDTVRVVVQAVGGIAP